MDTNKLNNEDTFIMMIYGIKRSGKTTLIKRLLKYLNYDILIIISCTKGYDELKNDKTFIFDDINEDLVKVLTNECSDLKRLIIFDDFMKIDFSIKKKFQAIKHLFTTTAHCNTNIIVSTHAIRQMPKIIRLSADKIITFMIDEDINFYLKQILSKSAFKKFNEIEGFEKYSFIYIDRDDRNNFYIQKLNL
jgi:AAA+ ATPase superfamily predicted ATPase